jgi:hypothetical protein
MSDDSPASVDFDFALSGDFTGQSLRLTGALAGSATVDLFGITVTVGDVELGIQLGVDIGGGGTDLVLSPTLSVQPPTAASAAVELPAVSGSGALAKVGDDWSGALQLQLSTFSVDAFAIISGGDELSFAVILCGRFPPPGIQVGFGFAVSGVGGMFALNRRSDPNAAHTSWQNTSSPPAALSNPSTSYLTWLTFGVVE